jgi:hypothetical protein
MKRHHHVSAVRATLLGALALAAIVASGSAHASPTSGSLSNAGFYKLQSIGNVTFTFGALITVTCTDVTIVSTSTKVTATTVTATGGNGASHVIFDKCTAPGNNITITTAGTWSVTAKDRTAIGPPELWNVSFTIDSAVLKVVGQDCEVTLDSPQSPPGVFNDDDPPNVPNTTITINSPVSFMGKGAFMLCPTGAGQATAKATFGVSANTQQDFKGSGVVVNLF